MGYVTSLARLQNVEMIPKIVRYARFGEKNCQMMEFVTKSVGKTKIEKVKLKRTPLEAL